MSKKVLVTGASGLLGREVLTAFQAADGWTATGLSFSRTGPGLTRLDLTDKEATVALITTLQPNLVVHCAAQRFPDKLEADYEKSVALNVASTGWLAQASKEVGGRLIYISTDYVFDGECAPYLVTDAAKPTNRYGETKLLGEEVVSESSADNIILRIPVLYGEVSYLEESALTSLLTTVTSKKPAKVSSYEVRCPAHAADIANIILDLAGKEPGVAGGIYQWSGLEKVTKWDIVQLIAQEAGLSVEHLEEVRGPSPGAPRPRDVEMDRSKLNELGISHHRDFKTGFMAALKVWLNANRTE